MSIKVSAFSCVGLFKKTSSLWRSKQRTYIIFKNTLKHCLFTIHLIQFLKIIHNSLIPHTEGNITDKKQAIWTLPWQFSWEACNSCWHPVLSQTRQLFSPHRCTFPPPRWNWFAAPHLVVPCMPTVTEMSADPLELWYHRFCKTHRVAGFF